MNTRNDIRTELLRCGSSLADVARSLDPPVSRVYVGAAVDNPDPQWGRKVKRQVARKLRRRIDELWPEVTT